MGFVKIAISITQFFFFLSAFSQNDTVRIKLTVTDGITTQAIAGVNIINPKSSVNFVTDSKGYFEKTIHKNDTLIIFYSGYTALRFTVSDSQPKREYIVHLMLNPFTTGLNRDIIIRAPKTLKEIGEERQVLGQIPKGLEKPKIQVNHPITTLYNLLSERNKERKKLKQQLAVDDKDRVLKDLLNYYNEKKIIDLPEERYDDFIRFCSLPTEFLRDHTDYEIMKTISTDFEKYARLSGLAK